MYIRYTKSVNDETYVYQYIHDKYMKDIHI